MSRVPHARFCERPRGQFPRPTRPHKLGFVTGMVSPLLGESTGVQADGGDRPSIADRPRSGLGMAGLDRAIGRYEKRAGCGAGVQLLY